jgi:hypothetical protein
MVIAAGRDERSLVSHALLKLKAENARVELERPVEV